MGKVRRTCPKLVGFRCIEYNNVSYRFVDLIQFRSCNREQMRTTGMRTTILKHVLGYGEPLSKHVRVRLSKTSHLYVVN